MKFMIGFIAFVVDVAKRVKKIVPEVQIVLFSIST
jgi:hypothetical protein